MLTVTDISLTCLLIHLQSRSELHHVSRFYYTLVIDLSHVDSEDDYRTGCRNVSHCQKQLIVDKR